MSPEAFARVEAATEAGTAKAVFVFTRHLGCPCAEATAARVHALAATRARCSTSSAGHAGGVARLPRARDEEAGAGVRGLGVAQPAAGGRRAGKLYSYFGVPVTGPMHMLKSSSAARAALAAEGHVNTTPGGGSPSSRPPPSSRCSRRRAPRRRRRPPARPRPRRPERRAAPRLGEGRDDHRAHPHLVHDGAGPFDDRHDVRAPEGRMPQRMQSPIYLLSIHTGVFTASAQPERTFCEVLCSSLTRNARPPHLS